MEKEHTLSNQINELDGDEDLFRCNSCGNYVCVDSDCGAQLEPDEY